MAGDHAFARFFAYLNFFVFAMLTLVLSDNFVGLLVGWGLVGLASYLLIGFWFERPSAVAAARKAFVINVVGDVGILLRDLRDRRQDRRDRLRRRVCERRAMFARRALCACASALFIGCAAKSAQVPLHTWLPDAMEGPTPVSALIHAATMVTAGVYLVARCAPLWNASSDARVLVGVDRRADRAHRRDPGLRAVGHQADPRLLDDVADRLHDHGRRRRRVRCAASLHFLTHAFFKAQLFLGAGHHHPQPRQRTGRAPMGGLRKKMPFAFAAMLTGVLSICGIPGFSGFFSKDAVLYGTLEHGHR